MIIAKSINVDKRKPIGLLRKISIEFNFIIKLNKDDFEPSLLNHNFNLVGDKGIHKPIHIMYACTRKKVV